MCGWEKSCIKRPELGTFPLTRNVPKWTLTFTAWQIALWMADDPTNITGI